MANTDTLLLATPLPGGELEVIRVHVPAQLTRKDLFLHIVANIPAGETQPYALNLDGAAVGS